MEASNSKEFYAVRCREYLMDYEPSYMIDGMDDDSIIRMAHVHHIKQLAREFNPELPSDLETVFYYRDTRPRKRESYYVFGGFHFIRGIGKYSCSSCLASTQYERMMEWNRKFSIDTADIRPFLITTLLELAMYWTTELYMRICE